MCTLQKQPEYQITWFLPKTCKKSDQAVSRKTQIPSFSWGFFFFFVQQQRQQSPRSYEGDTVKEAEECANFGENPLVNFKLPALLCPDWED